MDRAIVDIALADSPTALVTHQCSSAADEEAIEAFV